MKSAIDLGTAVAPGRVSCDIPHQHPKANGHRFPARKPNLLTNFLTIRLFAPMGERRLCRIDGEARVSEARVAVLDLHCLGESKRVAKDARAVPTRQLKHFTCAVVSPVAVSDKRPNNLIVGWHLRQLGD